MLNVGYWNLACSKIEVPSQFRVLRGQFSTPLSGNAFMILPQYDYRENEGVRMYH